MNVLLLHPDATPDHLGLIPSFLSDSDPRPACEQFNDNYAHGGGWRPLPNFSLKRFTLHYPGDPPFRPIGLIMLRDEMVLIYDHAIVVVLQRDGTFEAARMD